MPSVGPGGARIWRVDVRASLEGRVYYRIGPVYRSCPRERGALNFLAVAAFPPCGGFNELTETRLSTVIAAITMICGIAH